MLREGKVKVVKLLNTLLQVAQVTVVGDDIVCKRKPRRARRLRRHNGIDLCVGKLIPLFDSLPLNMFRCVDYEYALAQFTFAAF